MSYPTRPQSHQQGTKPLPTEFKEIRGLQKHTGTLNGAEILTTDITSKHHNCLKHIYCQMKDKQSRAFSSFPCIHIQT